MNNRFYHMEVHNDKPKKHRRNYDTKWGPMRKALAEMKVGKFLVVKGIPTYDEARLAQSAAHVEFRDAQVFKARTSAELAPNGTYTVTVEKLRRE